MSYDMIEDAVIVPTIPEGQIELRLDKTGTVCIEHWRYVQGEHLLGIKSRSHLVARVYVPLDALKQLEKTVARAD